MQQPLFDRETPSAVRLLDEQLRRIDIAGIHRSVRESVLPHYPGGLRLALKRRYFATATPFRQVLLGEERREAMRSGKGVDSWARANQELLEFHERLKAAKVHLAWSDDAVRDMARQCADICATVVRSHSAQTAYDAVKHMADHHQVRMPEPTRGKTLAGCVARLCDPKWWRRAIRSTYARQSEEIERDLELVSKFAGLYASDDSVARRRAQKVRNRAMLEAFGAVNDLGEFFTLSELSDVNVSNPAVRRAELMTRISGFEEFAKAHGHSSLFITVTLPSRFHVVHSQTGTRNRRFDGSSVRDGQRFLCNQWSKLRTHLQRKKHQVYGFRIAEPHQDGTPHWHLLLFMDSSSSDGVVAGFRRYFNPPEEAEPGSDLRRVEVVPIDPTKGSAAGYIAKYVSKNIDGFRVGRDLEARDGTRGDACGTGATGDVTGAPEGPARVGTGAGTGEDSSAQTSSTDPNRRGTRESTGATGAQTGDASETAKRVDAWASTSGIRQFQQIGGPPVTLWRETRRLKGPQHGVIEDARLAVEDQDWKRFWEVLGGLYVSRSDRPIHLHTSRGIKAGAYGEPVERQIKGLRAGALIVPTRLRTWTFIRSPESGSSWTRVNNCTAQLRTQDDYRAMRSETIPKKFARALCEPNRHASDRISTPR